MYLYWTPYRFIELYTLVSICTSLVYIPTVRKAGFSGWWVATSIIPIFGIVMLWVLAFARWPAQPER